MTESTGVRDTNRSVGHNRREFLAGGSGRTMTALLPGLGRSVIPGT